MSLFKHMLILTAYGVGSDALKVGPRRFEGVVVTHGEAQSCNTEE